jgi:hypothetical protein
MEIRALIERDQSTSRYVLTDTGSAVFRVLLKQAGFST